MSSVESWLLDDPTDAPNISDAPGWKVLVVDDEEEVHNVTQMVLQHFEFEQRPLRLMHAYSGQEAVDLVATNDDIALVLLDVVMENDAAGLQAAKRIRDELGNRRVRIVLRTGQPGQAPEHEVIANYDINDYKDKTELTSQKLKTLLYATLRSYRDLVTIESNQRGLEKVIAATASVYEQRELQRFASAVLLQMTHLLHLREEAVYLKSAPALVASTQQEHRLVIEAATGEYQAFITHYAEDVLPESVVADLQAAVTQRKSLFLADRYVLHYASSSGEQNVLYVGLDEPLDTFQQELLELLEPTVAALGFELWGIEYLSQGKHSVLRIYIDAEAGISVDDCARVSGQVSAVLDVEDPIVGEYTLEVSSPGMDRLLFRLDQFPEFVGEVVELRLRRPYEGRRNFKGVLQGIEGEDVVVRIDDHEYLLPYSAVDKARIHPRIQGAVSVTGEATND